MTRFEHLANRLLATFRAHSTPVAEVSPPGDGDWRPWDGSSASPHYGMVWVMFVTGEVQCVRSDHVIWRHGRGVDIIKWQKTTPTA